MPISWPDLIFPPINLWSAPRLMPSRHFKGFTNSACEFFPCHSRIPEKDFNCLFCYCPLIAYECPGPYLVFSDKNETKRKDCSNCRIPHDGIQESWLAMQKGLAKPVPWNGEAQSKAKLSRYEAGALRFFDQKDVEWADSQVIDRMEL